VKIQAGTPLSTDLSARDSEPSTIAWRPLVAIAVTGLALAPVVAVVLRIAGHDFLPTSDIAVTDLRVRDVFTTHPPLTGPYGRHGWSHPGPAFYVLPALVGLPFHHPAWATVVGGALWRGLAIGAIALISWRRGGLALLLVALGSLGFTLSQYSERFLFLPWNPFVAFPFFTLFLLLVWETGEGRAYGWIGTIVVGTFLIQTHIGYLPLVVVGIACAAAWTRTEVRRGKIDTSSLRRAAWISALIAVALWLPAIVEQMKNSPGNLESIARYFTGGSKIPHIGFRAGAELFAVEFRPPPPWFFHTDPTVGNGTYAAGASAVWLLVPVAMLTIAGVVAWRRDSRRAKRLVTLSSALSVVGLISLGRVGVNDELYYAFLWRSTIAVLVVLTFAIVLIDAFGDPRRSQLRRAGGAALAFAVLVGFGAPAVDILATPLPSEDAIRSMIDELPSPDDPVVVTDYSPNGDAGVRDVVANELVRQGAPLFADTTERFRYGDNRYMRARDASTVWYVTENGSYTAFLQTNARAKIVARMTPLSTDEEAELQQLDAEIIAAVLVADRADLVEILDQPETASEIRRLPELSARDIDRFVELNTKVRVSEECRCAVVSLPGARVANP